LAFFLPVAGSLQLSLDKTYKTYLLTASVALCLALTGCALTIDNAPINLPKATSTGSTSESSRVLPPKDIVRENLVALSFSGGGLRAAAFSFGVLQALKELGSEGEDLLDDLTFISSVSGGSLTAAYYGLHGKKSLETFPEKVLYQDMERGMRFSALAPSNFIRLLRGGLNDRNNLANWMDTKVFSRATFADIYKQQRPDIWINASDLFNRTPFPFIPPMFSAICSDLGAYNVAEAVSASMAVPLLFAPTLLKTYPAACTEAISPWVTGAIENPSASKTLSAAAQAVMAYRDPNRMKYVKLVDGGLTDNFGLSSILIGRSASKTPYGPLTARDAVKVNRMLFLVVDAGRGPNGDWAMDIEGPSGVDMALAATDSAVDSAARTAFDSFSIMTREWQRDVIDFRCSLKDEDVLRLRGSLANWNCEDVEFDIGLIALSDLGPEQEKRLNNIPTRLTLPKADIDNAIAAGREAALKNAALKLYLKQRIPAAKRLPTTSQH
jgi:NTE family protein